MVSLEVPSLDFQLVRVGKRATLALPLRNESSVPAIFSISPKSLEAGSSVLTVSMCVCTYVYVHTWQSSSVHSSLFTNLRVVLSLAVEIHI